MSRFYVVPSEFFGDTASKWSVRDFHVEIDGGCCSFGEFSSENEAETECEKLNAQHQANTCPAVQGLY